jgi:SulP family sulfate permease
MQTDLRSIIDTIEGALVGEELLHDSVDMAFTGADPNELTDSFSNVLLVTNLVHTRLMQVAEEVDIVAILFTDLLVGVIIGLLVGAFFILKEQADAPGLTVLSPPGAVLTRYALGQQATFLTKVRIEKTLNELAHGSRVEIDARDCRRIDPDVLQLLHDFRDTARQRGIDYRLVAVPELAGGGLTSH